jgi:hypothetical protein
MPDWHESPLRQSAEVVQLQPKPFWIVQMPESGEIPESDTIASGAKPASGPSHRLFVHVNPAAHGQGHPSVPAFPQDPPASGSIASGLRSASGAGVASVSTIAASSAGFTGGAGVSNEQAAMPAAMAIAKAMRKGVEARHLLPPMFDFMT